jgi:N-acetylglutamate synthase-like GNAT family acetyltransferase
MKLRVVEPDTVAFAALERQLKAAGLPTEDLIGEGGRYYALGEGGRDALAFVGLTALGDEALLRSLVVPVSGRGQGLGRDIATRLLALAQTYGIRRVWLLTTDAEGFFSDLGFRAVDRAQAPPEIAATQQFRGVCPASAVLMRRDLDQQ